MRGFFVTGTDTGVGKTLIAAALLIGAGNRGLRTAGIKPLAAGCELLEGRRVNADAVLLQRCSTLALPYEDVNPVLLDMALAPHLAAARQGVGLGAESLAEHCRRVQRLEPDVLVIEGAGGWLVPLNDHETMADMCASLGLPVIMVVGMKLGCLNHALLTAAAIERTGLKLAGWIANSAWPEMPALEDNIITLEQRLGALRLATIPWLGEAVSAERIAGLIELRPLLNSHSG